MLPTLDTKGCMLALDYLEYVMNTDRNQDSFRKSYLFYY